MELWNEYEGRTIDGIFPLAKLLQPEGRSAFFSTPNGSGSPTVIRLIESHFDDEEILARWRGVAALNHPNLVKLKKFGQVELDGTPLVYAVMEPAEANLGEIVNERRLTVAETTQIATSLVSALQALHEHGFVHEHVEPGNVLAVGEEIKLRSDCIRETPEGAEGIELKRRDVCDLATVLLRALTQQRTLEGAARELPLPAPFDAIVRKGMSGDWGLPEIAAALASGGAPAIASRPVAAVVAPRPVERMVDGSDGAVAPAPVVRAERLRAPVESEPGGMWSGSRIAMWVGVMVVLLVGWYLLRGRPVKQASPEIAAPVAAGPAAVPESTPVSNSGAVKPNARVKASTVAAADVAPARSEGGAGDRQVQWRVIAFTYNHEDQAKAKVARIAEKHPELRPEVFTPSGHAPYLVTIGGAMGRDEAFALARKARGAGLPGDSYAQNYKVR